MAGHNKWSKIKRQKGVNDAKRGAIFTRIGNQIAIAARGGTDPDMNPSLALAIEKARAVNMPNANIERAIARAADKNSAILEEITYEGYGPNGIGLIIETATDNRNRTFPEVKTALVKNGGRIADAGSVMFQFTRKGVILVDVVEEDGEIVVYTDQKDLMKVRKELIEKSLTVKEAELQYVPNMEVEITDDETRAKVEKLMDALDDVDDVVNVHTNAKL